MASRRRAPDGFVVDGQDVAALDKAGLIALRRRVGMVFQHFNLLSAKTAWGNIALPLVVVGRPESQRSTNASRKSSR